MNKLELMIENQKNIPIQLLNKLFTYDSETGTLLINMRSPSDFKSTPARSRKARCSNWNRRFAGKPAGSEFRSETGTIYLKVSIGGEFVMYAHQIIWAMVHGEWAGVPLDHIDGRGLNNRINNLRKIEGEVSNSKNMKLNRNSKSGIHGVRHIFGKRGVTYQVVVSEGNRQVSKRFKDFFEACCFRKSFEVRNGYSDRHGEVK